MDTRYDTAPGGGSRAKRRHHRARLKRARQFYYGENLADYPVKWGKSIDTPTPCSCYLCRNPRRDGGLTIQERRGRQILLEDVD